MEHTSSKAYGLNINDFVSEEFLEKLRNEFKEPVVIKSTSQLNAFSNFF